MKVKELIAKLQKLPPEAEVVYFNLKENRYAERPNDFEWERIGAVCEFLPPLKPIDTTSIENHD